MDWLTIGSIVLNIVLMVALFFRGPLNELAKRMGLGWLDRRERQRMLLQQLYGEVDNFAASYFALILYCRFAWDPAMSKLVTRERDNMVDDLLAEYAKHYAFLEGNYLSFPPSIRSLLKEFKAAVWFSPEIGPRGFLELNPEKVKAAIQEVGRLTKTIREALDREA